MHHRVEDQLFKVPRRLFADESEIFRVMFTCPVPEGSEPDGSSDAQPLHLEGIAAKDFVLLLQCIYPVIQCPTEYPIQAPLLSLEEWTSVLELACRYEMPKAKALAVAEMTSLVAKNPAFLVHMARKYEVEDWLMAGVHRLVVRPQPIKKEDVELIGLDDALEIMACREACQPKSFLSDQWVMKERGRVSWDFSKELKQRFHL
ncbi:hypothetical protein AX17_002447 [Amanita inopinata Kibby_2008]|nr:hypothetical protein AX17_002447 [Amanita inopinata Kibby_2008]